MTNASDLSQAGARGRPPDLQPGHYGKWPQAGLFHTLTPVLNVPFLWRFPGEPEGTSHSRKVKSLAY